MRAPIRALALILGATACSPAEEATTPPPAPIPAIRLSRPANPRDPATLDSLRSFTTRVDADTARLPSIERTVELGAGSTGTLTAWRSDSAWHRIHVDAQGAGYRTADTYWLHEGTLVAARLTVTRPEQPPATEDVWFNGDQLLRWVDPQGRQLSSEAQSTRSEVAMLRDRVARVVAALPEPRPDRPEKD